MLRPSAPLRGALSIRRPPFSSISSQGVGHSVGHGESYVLDASATAVVGDELGYGAVFGRGFEKLDLGLSDAEEGCAHFLIGHLFDSEAL